METRCTTIIRSGELLTVVTPSALALQPAAVALPAQRVFERAAAPVRIGPEAEGDGQGEHAVGRAWLDM